MVWIIVLDWRLVTQEAKEELWKLLKLRFDGLEDDMKKKIVQHIGTLWRSWKSRVTSDLKQALEDGWSDDEINSKLQPEGVDLADWSTFRKERESTAFKETSKKFKELRSKHKLPHTMSRKGYARLEEEMKAKSGRADISRADLWIESHKNKKEQPHNDKIAGVVQQNNPPNICGKKCMILDWLSPKKIVGEGEVESDDPMHLVDGIPIGGNAYLVYVERKDFIKGLGGDYSKAYSRAIALAGEAITNIYTVCIWFEDVITKQFSSELHRSNKKALLRAHIMTIGFGTSHCLAYFSYALGLWYSSKLIKNKESNFGDTLKTFIVLIFTATTIAETFGVAPDIVKGTKAVESVFNILERRTEIEHEDSISL
ncbi:hypothetical protein Sjap_020408 [Stephania japonica]|uniref:ABC transmembrane type-1 domain-containing protein n=1 Tax=Stephania japonica TaxID=461633 RepID=A0AAP0I0N2_9MAGN